MKKWLVILMAMLSVATCAQGRTRTWPAARVLDAAISLITNQFPAVASDQLKLIDWNPPGATPPNFSNYRLCFGQTGWCETNYPTRRGQPLQEVESFGYVVLMDADFKPLELPEYNLVHGVITTSVELASTLLLPGDKRIAKCAAEYPYRSIEHLPPEVYKSLWNKTRDEVRATLGNPAKTYPQDGGEAWEYRSEHQRLTVEFHEKGIVESYSVDANPEYGRKTHALWRLLGGPDSNAESKMPAP